MLETLSVLDKNKNYLVIGNMKVDRKEMEDFKKVILSNIPDNFKSYKKNIEFKPYKPPHNSKDEFPLMPVAYRKPLEFYYNRLIYRIVPRYPAYAVSYTGDIINYYTKVKLDKIKLGNYYRVTVYDPFFKKNVNRSVHRLVAMAWVPNDDFVEKNVVDHIDGNKYNNIASNLRWVKNGENTAYAVNSTDSRWVLMNIETNEIKHFYSLQQVADFLKIVKSRLAANKMPIYVESKEKGKWIIDDSENFSNFGLNKPITGLNNKSIYQLIIDGELEKVYENIMDLLRDHGKQGRLSLKDTKKYIRDYYKRQGKTAVIIEIAPVKSKGPYYAKNMKTGEIVKANTIWELSQKLNIPESTLIPRFTYKYGYPIDNWIFKRATDKRFPKPKIIPNKKKKIKATNGNETKIFESMREAAKFFNRDRKTILKRINNKTELDGWKIEFIND